MSNELKIIAAESAKEYYFREGCHILEMWNSPEDTDVSIARARVEPGRVTRVHRLAGTTERYVILEGRGRFISGKVREYVSPGHVVVIPAGCEQSIENTGETDLVFLAICSPRFMLPNYSDEPEA